MVKDAIKTQYIPLVLGVTGHRDITPDDARLARDVVRYEIKRLAALAPDTPLELLSSLAAGADRIVAEVALEEGIPLTVILPMKSELYEEDFTPEEVTEYRELLSGASNVGVQSPDHGRGRGAAVAGPAHPRDHRAQQGHRQRSEEHTSELQSR